MPLAIIYLAGAAVVGGSIGYSLNKIEDITKLALVGGAIYLGAKALKVI